MWRRRVLILSLILFISGCAPIHRVRRTEEEVARLKRDVLALKQENVDLREELKLRDRKIEDLQRRLKREIEIPKKKPEKKQPPLK